MLHLYEMDKFRVGTKVVVQMARAAGHFLKFPAPLADWMFTKAFLALIPRIVLRLPFIATTAQPVCWIVVNRKDGWK